jgi:MFS family permease
MAVSGLELASRPPGAARRGHHPALALTVIAASQLMVVLDATIVNVALPQMQQALGFSTTDLSWVLNAYTLTFGGLLLLGGRAGDILGRRRVFIAGILIFTLASFLGGLATSAGWLLAALAPLYITESERQPGRFDLAGALTSTAGMTALVYGFIRAAQDGWSNPATIGSFAVAAVLLAAFFRIETRTRQPITPLHLFADRDRAGSYAIMLALAAAMFGMFFFTLFVQDVLG